MLEVEVEVEREGGVTCMQWDWPSPSVSRAVQCVCPGRYDWYEHSCMPLTVTGLFDPNLSLLFLFGGLTLIAQIQEECYCSSAARILVFSHVRGPKINMWHSILLIYTVDKASEVK